jgi:hypothetical protein
MSTLSVFHPDANPALQVSTAYTHQSRQRILFN